MTHDRFGRLARVANAQDGVFARSDAAAFGVDRRRLNRAEAAGVIEQVHPQVFRFTAAPPTRRGAVRAGVLQVVDATASHESALSLHGVERVPFGVVVTVPARGTHRHEGIRVHRAVDLLESHLQVIDGIPTTTIERAVVDAATVFSPSRRPGAEESARAAGRRIVDTVVATSTPRRAPASDVRPVRGLR